MGKIIDILLFASLFFVIGCNNPSNGDMLTSPKGSADGDAITPPSIDLVNLVLKLDTTGVKSKAAGDIVQKSSGNYLLIIDRALNDTLSHIALNTNEAIAYIEYQLNSDSGSVSFGESDPTEIYLEGTLAYGDNTLVLTVTSTEGAVETYTIEIVKADYASAELTGMTLSLNSSQTKSWKNDFVEVVASSSLTFYTTGVAYSRDEKLAAVSVQTAELVRSIEYELDDLVVGMVTEPIGKTVSTSLLNVDLVDTSSRKGVRNFKVTTTALDGTTKETLLFKIIFFEMANIPSGSFIIDKRAEASPSPAPVYDPDDSNLITMGITRPYKIGATEMTRDVWYALMGKMPSGISVGGSFDEMPLGGINWYDAIIFCNKLSIVAGLAPVYTVTGVDFSGNVTTPTTVESKDLGNPWNNVTWEFETNGYRLPTEMEWMWAAMGADYENQGMLNTAGYQKAYAGDPVGDNYNAATNGYGAYGWFNTTTPKEVRHVAGKTPNELGLYDMSGNVFEWVWDWYENHGTKDISADEYYSNTGENDYKGIPDYFRTDIGIRRMVKGGSFNYGTDKGEIRNRGQFEVTAKETQLGFRVVCTNN